MTQTAALYVHFPFCEIRCGYCDFFTVTRREDQIPAFWTALTREMAIYAADPAFSDSNFSTLFFGGGTPSLLTPEQIFAFIEQARRDFHLQPDCEITLEANPATLTQDRLRALWKVGINRLSLGVQSFHANELQFLERDHSADQARLAFHAARAAGFENISIDLIFALPGQPLNNWQKTLSEVVSLAPDHISAYNLTYEDGTPLTTQLKQGRFRRLDDEEEGAMQLAAMEILGENGYTQYEISNYARPGFACKHNQKYWDGSNYLGLGPSAHSFWNQRRFWNVRNLKGYFDAIEADRLPVAGEETLDEKTIAFELVYLGLRQNRGLDLQNFAQRTNVDFFEKHAATLRNFFQADFSDPSFTHDLCIGTASAGSDLLEITGGHLRLTRNGIILCDAICVEFA